MKIAIIGHGRAGKDEVAEWLQRNTPLTYAGSISWHCKEEVARRLNQSVQYAWEHRAEHRTEWRDIINDLRRHDPGCIINRMLRTQDIIAGIRPRVEFEAVRDRFSAVIWVARDVPEDPTLELTIDDATHVINNNESLDHLHHELRRLCTLLCMNKDGSTRANSGFTLAEVWPATATA